MLSWWSDLETVALVNTWLLSATVVFSMVTGVLSLLTTRKSKGNAERLLRDLEISRKQLKSLEKTAEEIRKELLQTQQHQDINQLKLKSTTSSALGLEQALLDAQRRLETAEKAVKAHKAKEDQREKRNDEKQGIEDEQGLAPLDLLAEDEDGLTESRREQLMDLLDPGPKGNVDIFCVLDDALSASTAKHLESILSADGWKTSPVAQSAFSDPPQGLLLAVNSKETAPSYASFLQRVFTTIGLPVSATIDKKYREWSLTIIVGTLAKNDKG
jgi:hypothetical protein